MFSIKQQQQKKVQILNFQNKQLSEAEQDLIATQKKSERGVLYDMMFQKIGHDRMVCFQNFMIQKISFYAGKHGIPHMTLKGSYMTFLSVQSLIYTTDQESQQYLNQLRNTFGPCADLDFGTYYDTLQEQRILTRKIEALISDIIADKEISDFIVSNFDYKCSEAKRQEFQGCKFKRRNMDHRLENGDIRQELIEEDLGIYSLSYHQGLGTNSKFDLFRLFVRIPGQKYDGEFLDFSLSRRIEDPSHHYQLNQIMGLQSIRDQVGDAFQQFQLQKLSQAKMIKVQSKLLLALQFSHQELEAVLDKYGLGIQPSSLMFEYGIGPFLRRYIVERLRQQYNLEPERVRAYSEFLESTPALRTEFNKLLHLAFTIQNQDTQYNLNKLLKSNQINNY